MSSKCKGCPYFYNGTYGGHCEQVMDKCEQWAEEKSENEKWENE